MKSKVFKTTRFILLTLLTAFILNFVSNIFTFNQLLSSNYQTPWYDSAYIKEPYTNLRLSLASEENKNTSWLLNSIRTEAWLVQTTKIEDKIFWTILERKDISHIKDK